MQLLRQSPPGAPGPSAALSNQHRHKHHSRLPTALRACRRHRRLLHLARHRPFHRQLRPILQRLDPTSCLFLLMIWGGTTLPCTTQCHPRPESRSSLPAAFGLTTCTCSGTAARQGEAFSAGGSRRSSPRCNPIRRTCAPTFFRSRSLPCLRSSPLLDTSLITWEKVRHARGTLHTSGPRPAAGRGHARLTVWNAGPYNCSMLLADGWPMHCTAL